MLSVLTDPFPRTTLEPYGLIQAFRRGNKGQGPREYPVANHAHGPHISGFSKRLFSNDLRGNEAPCATNAGERDAVDVSSLFEKPHVGYFPGEAKVTDLCREEERGTAGGGGGGGWGGKGTGGVRD
jgi:hypothetical protein